MKTNQKGFTFIELLTIVALIGIVLSLIISPSCNRNPGEGTKIGQIVKLNREGMFNTTWEAELIRGGINNGNGSFGTTPFNFTIPNDEMAKKVNDYLEKQTEVIIKYQIESFYLPFRSNSNGHFLLSIEPVKK